tara:strand:- start:1726 stop:2367 length:642 start_codon:yes stop_codon:yes gene_type:complete
MDTHMAQSKHLHFSFELPRFSKDPSHTHEARANWVIPSTEDQAGLIAGYYPTDKSGNNKIIKELRNVAGKIKNPAKILYFVDLTEKNSEKTTRENWLASYTQHLADGEGYVNFPLRDGKGSDDATVSKAARHIVKILMDPKNLVYVHCWGGHGRTGMVVAKTLMVKYKMEHPTAVYFTHLAHDSRYDTKRRNSDKVPSPEHQEQIACVKRAAN